jgi:hypothetical protein
VKRGAATEYLIKEGSAELGEAASDGGNFLRFKDARTGMLAAERLLTGPLYNNLTIDAALRKWSNNGYGGEIAQNAGIDPKLRVRDLSPNQISALTSAMARAESGIAEPKGRIPGNAVFGSTDVPAPPGISEIPPGTRMSIPNLIYTPPPSSEGKKPTAPAKPKSGTAEAAEPPARTETTQTTIADLLNLPLTSDVPVQEPASITVPIEKESPPAAPVPETKLAATRRLYDLRGLSPAEVNQVVNNVLEARKIAATTRAGNAQLVETEDGYLLVDKVTGDMTPLTTEGKIDARRSLDMNRTSKLSTFSQEMSTPDYRLRGRMNESQSKAFEFGSRALQANERQTRLESRLPAKDYANQRTYLLQTLEALPADVPMNVINQLLTTGSVLVGTAKTAYQDWLAKNPEATEAERIRTLTTLGLGASEARAMAILENRRALTPGEREFLANQLEFSMAILRRESGAAINAGEFTNTFRQYFPMEGDTEADVMRKMRTRRQAIRGLRSSAGRPLLVPDVD